MSKAIKWQIPFASLSGTLYRIDIYAEGYSGDPIQLTAGESPFVTDEDSSEDFFAPIRTQTGSIQVCTRKPDGTMLTLDEILPANNIDHPVRLINLSNSNAIEWQGFLSCEAYSQNYTAIPENLTLSVISVLEAMDSVQLDQTHSTGLTTIKSAIKTALEEIRLQSGMSPYDYVNYSGSSYRIFNKYIDQTVFFELKEYTNESAVTYIVSGISVKDVLSRLATYMGWSVREQGRTLYFERIGGDIYTFTDTYAQFGGTNPSVQIVNLAESAIANFDWMGTDHKRDIRQGAKSVGVVAKLEKYDFRLSLPEMPDQNLIHNSVTSDNRPIESYTSKDITFDNRLDFYYEKVHRVNSTTTKTAEGSVDDAFRGCIINSENDFSYKVQVYNQTFEYERYIGAFFAKLSYNNGDFKEGLYIAATNKATTDDTGVVFKIRSGIETVLFNGKLKLTASALAYNFFNFYHNYDNKLEMIIQCGSKYWNGSAWTSTESYCEVQFTNGKAEMDMDITDRMKGEVSVRIRGCILGGQGNAPVYYYNYDLFLTELNVEFEPNEDASLSLRGENKYFRLLDTNFRDEISVGTDLASSLNNQPSPSLIMEDLAGTTPMTELDYTVSGGGTESRRPEVDLLNRLASYYGASRQTLDLITKHPVVNNAAAVLPLLKLNGINDGKTYLPLSESRDWREETCTLTCFETPE